MAFKRLFIISCLYLMVGCLPSTPTLSPEARALHAARLAKSAGWKEHTIPTPMFTLKAYGPVSYGKARVLTIYIEGDGLAWLSLDTPSDNPTPMTPMGLNIALHDQTHHPVVYLARPCQFVFNQAWAGCRKAYWTNRRFSPEVIEATDNAVDKLKKYYHAQKIMLIGYSGGGTIAALVAARRTDVVRLITVAAILDVKAWVRQKSLTPLNGSLNPADEWKKLAKIPQVHWVGGRDKVVPKEVLFAYANHFPVSQKPDIRVIPAFDHTCCWAKDWSF